MAFENSTAQSHEPMAVHTGIAEDQRKALWTARPGADAVGRVDFPYPQPSLVNRVNVTIP